MSTLHYRYQGMSTPLGNPLSDPNMLSKLYHSITPQQLEAFEYIVCIHAWLKEVPCLLKREVIKSRSRSGGWAPRKDSVVHQALREALDSNISEDHSLRRYIYCQARGLGPVIVMGLIQLNWRETFNYYHKKTTMRDNTPIDEGMAKKRGKISPEEEASLWPTTAKQFLVETLKGIELPPEIVTGLILFKSSKRKNRETEDWDELDLRATKQLQQESSHPEYSPKIDVSLLGTARTGESHIQEFRQSISIPEPQPQPRHSGNWTGQSKLVMFPVTVVELNEALIDHLGKSRLCYAKKLGPSSESPVRVDPIGTRTGLFSIFLGQTAKHLAKRASPIATSKDQEFTLSSSHLSSYMLDLVEPEDTYDMVYCQGIAIVWLSPDCFLGMMGSTFVTIQQAIEGARAGA